MTRAKLSDEERERRRKERNKRSFSDAAYRHYDPRKEGFGSVDEWIATASAAASGTGGFKRMESARSDTVVELNLATLGLDDLPQDLDALKKAFRAKLFKVHPDYGGSERATIAAKTAYDSLTKHYE